MTRYHATTTHTDSRGLRRAALAGLGLAILAIAVGECYGQDVAENTLPDAPTATAVSSSRTGDPFSGLALTQGARIAAARKEPFLADPANRLLAGMDLAVRVADAITTHRDDTGPDPCCHEKPFPLGVPMGLAKSRGMIAYSIGISAGVDLGARILWQHNHRKLARAVVMADVVGDGQAVLGNIKAEMEWKGVGR